MVSIKSNPVFSLPVIPQNSCHAGSGFVGDSLLRVSQANSDPSCDGFARLRNSNVFDGKKQWLGAIGAGHCV